MPLVLGITVVLTISVSSLAYYSAANTRTVNHSKDDTRSFSLSESGLANAMAVLANPTNNALDPDTLPNTEATASSAAYEGGTAKWYGVLDRSTAVWTVTALGLHNNATGPGTAQVRRTLTAKVPVVPVNTQATESPAWNYLYSRRTGNACDMTLNNQISGSARIYVAGNFCLHNATNIANGPLIVRGNLDVTHKDASVGAPTDMSTRVETYVGGNCRRLSGAWVVPCVGDQDALKIYSKRDGPSYVSGVNNTAPFVPEPAVDFANWYENGIPGPSQSCTTVSGTPPTFDTNYPSRDNSVPVFELLPGSSYTCRVGPAGNASGELSWSASTKTLTVKGTIYIDGSVRATNGQVNSYNGQGSLYLTGTFVIDAGTKLCASISGSNCNFAGWDPNSEMMTVAANGNDGTGNGIVVNSNSSFQGALYATNNVYLNNSVKVDGPVIGNTLIINNAVSADAFPTVTTVPVGMPGEESVYAQPNPPQLFAG